MNWEPRFIHLPLRKLHIFAGIESCSDILGHPDLQSQLSHNMGHIRARPP